MNKATSVDLLTNIQKASDYAPEAVELWGEDKQIRACIEEMGELTVILCHYLRGRVSREAVWEEIADVLISTTTLVELFGADECVSVMQRKLAKYRSALDVSKQLSINAFDQASD